MVFPLSTSPRSSLPPYPLRAILFLKKTSKQKPKRSLFFPLLPQLGLLIFCKLGMSELSITVFYRLGLPDSFFHFYIHPLEFFIYLRAWKEI